jgi:hypothetical protein
MTKNPFGAMCCNIAAQPGPAIVTIPNGAYSPQTNDIIEEF